MNSAPEGWFRIVSRAGVERHVTYEKSRAAAVTLLRTGRVRFVTIEALVGIVGWHAFERWSLDATGKAVAEEADGCGEAPLG